MAKPITEKMIQMGLINIYRDNPCLWDPGNKNYSNRVFREKAYKAILEKYRQFDENFNLYDVKKKIEFMRSTYRREHNKVLAAHAKGEEYVPVLWYYQHMTFLNPTLKFGQQRRSTGTTQSEKIAHVDISQTSATEDDPVAKRPKLSRYSRDDNEDDSDENEENECIELDDDRTNNSHEENISTEEAIYVPTTNEVSLAFGRVQITENSVKEDMINIYRNNPCLWDPSNKNYTNRLVREKAYKAILKKYRHLDENASLSDAKKKIEFIRGVYRREHNKVLAAQSRGEKRKPTLWYYKHMTFLNPTLKVYKPKEPAGTSQSEDIAHVDINQTSETEDEIISKTLKLSRYSKDDDDDDNDGDEEEENECVELDDDRTDEENISDEGEKYAANINKASPVALGRVRRITERTIKEDMINIYRKSPCLWDLGNKNYSNKLVREKAYKVILDKYRQLDENASLRDAKQKIEIMRGAYRREHKKVLAAQARDEERTSKLWYYRHMTFLNSTLKVYQQRPSTGSNQTENPQDITHIDMNQISETEAEPGAKSIKLSRHSKDDNDDGGDEGEEIDNAELLDDTHEENISDEEEKYVATKNRASVVFARAIGLQLIEMEPDQRYIAEKLISDVIYYGRLKKLHPNTSFALNED